MQRRNLIKVFALSASVISMGMAFGTLAADTIKWVFCIRCPARWLFLKHR